MQGKTDTRVQNTRFRRVLIKLIACQESPAFSRQVAFFIDKSVPLRNGIKRMGTVLGKINHAIAVTILEQCCDLRFGNILFTQAIRHYIHRNNIIFKLRVQIISVFLLKVSINNSKLY